jgi:hypothetical protein
MVHAGDIAYNSPKLSELCPFYQEICTAELLLRLYMRRILCLPPSTQSKS